MRLKKHESPTTQRSRMVSNTFFLYAMTFSTQLFSLATVPYLTRVLGAVVYGKVGLAVAYMTFVQIILDFGFILSATQRVAENRTDKPYLSQLITSTLFAKLALSGVLTIVLGVYMALNDGLREDMLFILAYYIGYGINALMPDFFYRGMENMKAITYRTIAVKAFFMAMVFVFIKDPGDYSMIPLFSALGNGVTVIIMYRDIQKKYGVKFCRTPIKTVLMHSRYSAQFFVSRISSAAYQATNTIVLGYIYGNDAIIGLYTSADKLVSLVKGGSAPVADSIFPYMVKNRNFQLVKMMLWIFMPVIAIGLTICFIYAEPICRFLFGEEYAGAGGILRALTPAMLVIFPSYLLSFPVMVPLGLTKYANAAGVFGLCLQAVLLTALKLFGRLDVYTLCMATSATEVGVFLFGVITVLVFRRRTRARSGSRGRTHRCAASNVFRKRARARNGRKARGGGVALYDFSPGHVEGSTSYLSSPAMRRFRSPR